MKRFVAPSLLAFQVFLCCCSSRCFSLTLHRSYSVSLRMSSQDEVLAIPCAENALRSSRMARHIRTLRTNRGREAPSSSRDPAEQAMVPALPPRRSMLTPPGGKKKQAPPVKAKNALTYSYSSALKVLTAYHTIHGDLVLPRRFVVPDSSTYPEEWHGVDLASTVYRMRWWQLHVRQHPDRVAELNSLGFCWQRLQPEWNLILEALITYSALHGHLLVPISFVVPHGDDDWPKATWGLTLGKCVFRMRVRNDFLKGSKGAMRRSQLDGLGFCWDVSEYVFEKFCAALVHYKKLQTTEEYMTTLEQKNALKVPSTFVVPCNDPTWPRGLWDYPLGAKCVAVRQKGLYVKGNARRLERLRDFGFCFHGNAARGWLQVVHAAAIYSQLHNRCLNVPQSFVVPSPPEQDTPGFYVSGCNDKAWPWPSQLWGFPLGLRLKDVRLKGAYLKGKDAGKRKAQLDALGFDWNVKRGGWKQEVKRER